MNEDDDEKIIEEIPTDDPNASWRENENTPWKRDETSHHSINISRKRWEEIFGHD